MHGTTHDERFVRAGLAVALPARLHARGADHGGDVRRHCGAGGVVGEAGAAAERGGEGKRSALRAAEDAGALEAGHEEAFLVTRQVVGQLTLAARAGVSAPEGDSNEGCAPQLGRLGGVAVAQAQLQRAVVCAAQRLLRERVRGERGRLRATLG